MAPSREDDDDDADIKVLASEPKTRRPTRKVPMLPVPTAGSTISRLKPKKAGFRRAASKKLSGGRGTRGTGRRSSSGGRKR